MAAIVPLIALSLTLLLFFKLFYSSKKKKSLPPSPPSLPIIGHLHLFKKPLHHALSRLSDRYGPVLLLRFGSRPVLVVSSPSVAEECFSKNDIVFANRAHLPSGKQLTYNYTTLGAAGYGPHWRNIRRIATLEILSSNRLHSFSDVRAEEMCAMIGRLFRESGEQGRSFQKVELKSRLFELSLNVMMRMIAGKRYYGEEVADSEEARQSREIVEEILSLSGASNVGDFLPILRWIDFQGLTSRVKRVAGKRDAFLQVLIEENRKEGGGDDGKEGEGEKKKKTMIRVLLSLQESDPEYYTDQIIKALVLSMLLAGTDTSPQTIEWAMSLLLNNPETLKKAKAEIDSNVEHGRLLQESNLSNLPYLHCIINETLRMYPAGPLLVPHESAEECVVGGFDIPSGTMLLVNAYSIHRNPELWEEPTKFKPERFKDGKGEGFMIPFGMGRRRCPGEGLAMRVVGLVLGALIQSFEWERVGTEEVDMTEAGGLTLAKANALEAMYKPRQTMIDALSGL